METYSRLIPFIPCVIKQQLRYNTDVKKPHSLWAVRVSVRFIVKWPQVGLRLRPRALLGQFRFGTIRAYYFGAIGNETLPDEAALASGAQEAVVVPVPVFERNEPGSADASDGLLAATAALGVKGAEAVRAVGFILPRSKALSSQRSTAVRARKALLVPGFVPVGHASRRNDLRTLHAASGVLFFVTIRAEDFVFSRDETFSSYGFLALSATETVLVPLMPLVFHLLHPCFEGLGASVATGSKRGIVAIGAIDSLGLRTKRFVHQRNVAFGANEARLMPMLVFV
jgi:hypothetical protein